MRFRTLAFTILFLSTATPTILAGIDARMLRQPDVSKTHIAFVYAGDIWTVPKNGGAAQRLSSPQGEESFPRFSPDGTQIAFTANYDGNSDIYVVPSTGGTPTRVTHHPAPDRILDWYPDGSSLLFATSMTSGRQRFNQLYKVATTGGLPEKLPIPYGEFGTVSPDGQWLSYTPIDRSFRTWKRYRGGMAPDIWLFDLQEESARNVTSSDANDTQPMWHGTTMYFLSDRGDDLRANIWAFDTRRNRFEQITAFSDYDVSFPSIGPDDLVFEAGGRLHLLNLKNGKHKEVSVTAITDQRSLKPHTQTVGDRISSGWLSPTGKRVAFEARGEIFTVPAEHGAVRNLTNSPGVAERSPAWSPDGKHIAYWSDRMGEYQLTVREAAGNGSEETLTEMGAGFRYQPYWSPDSRKLAFVDQTMSIQLFDRDTKQVTSIDKGLYMLHGNLANFSFSWSADSRWLAYSRALENRVSAIFLYDTQEGKLTQATAGYYNDALPAFDPDGKYLYYASNRTLRPSYSDIDNTWIYPNTTNIVAASLRPDVPSPLAPRSDDEKVKEEEPKKTEQADTGSEKKATDEKKAENKTVEIDVENLERRVVILPPEAGNYTGLDATKGKVIYRRLPRTGASRGTRPALVYYDLKTRKEQTVMEGATGYQLSADQKKLLVVAGRRFGIIDLKPKQKIDKPLRTAELQMTVDPKAEWKQIFNDAWRLQRDYFYDPNMHGVDWSAMRTHYGKLIDESVTRWDVNVVLGDLIGELNASHTYRGGGDTENTPTRNVGLLGVDWALENGAYRIQHIVRGAAWDVEVRSPLDEPGVDVKEGSYVLAVNGVKIDTSKDPWAAFQGLGNRTVSLTVNETPSMDGAREVLVKTMRNENRLRHLEWIEMKRQRVDEASNGRVGYIYVRSTGVDGQTELVRQYAAQTGKDALIIDERFNSGGQIPDRFIELLNRPAQAFWAVRDGQDWNWPPAGHFGPKVMLINGWSGSGGDAFPYYFKKTGLGPLIGMRTWGGLIGISGAPALIDGGGVTVPTFRMYSTDGTWFEEGHGVEPDIEVVDDQAQLAKGIDPQLERGIQESIKLLSQQPPTKGKRPSYEDRRKAIPPR